jgi:hypothetical protein
VVVESVAAVASVALGSGFGKGGSSVRKSVPCAPDL